MPQYEQNITDTLELNYMPYAMSVIVSRAIPEIDGFKPAHRKLLYTMYKMGLLNGKLTKSANVVGQTMRLNPHGDAAIYDTMVRLTRGHEALLHPFVESKGNFGKHTSRDTAYAAARYTEVKLDGFSAELFAEIDHDTVDMVDNYDSTMKEPALLPVTFPNILVNPNQGVAVGMATNICSFNLTEICNTTIELIKNPQHDILTTLTAPDFPSGAQLIYDANALRNIYDTGSGSFRLRSKYRYDKKSNCLEIYEIPYNTTLEAGMDKIIELCKLGKLKEISAVRDETDINGLKLAIDLKRGVNPDLLMQKLYKMTPLESSFSCNFNVLVGYSPKVMGVGEILNEWIAFRMECIRRATFYDIGKKKECLHLLQGLRKILLDIDEAIRIIRQTEEAADVVPNLMIGFGIDQVQAEYVADIKLRNLNREYILNKTAETDALAAEIEDLEDLLNKPKRIHKLIIKQLQAISKKYGKPRKTQLLYPDELEEIVEEEPVDDYAVSFFLSKAGYFKKITPLSLRMGGEQKYKEGDDLLCSLEGDNAAEVLIFTDHHQVYKIKASEFADTKASVLGDFLPQKLAFDEGEVPVAMFATRDYSGHLVFFFANGKAVRVPLSAYETKQNRKKLINAYSDVSPLVSVYHIREDAEFYLHTSNNRHLLLNSSLIPEKVTRNANGVTVLSLKAKNTLDGAEPYQSGTFVKPDGYRASSIPVAGFLLKEADKKK
ncbi:MAG: topoisomerase IV [Clostridia bacterium]|nr:topoisomerase IV [Clostridia bacterium]